MSHHFDCVVDTKDMAQEMSKVKKHVDATTTAVVGMQAAVIKAQKDGADHVCRKVNQGFYAMIHSQISQKMATLQSKVDAQLMRLGQQRKQLTAIRNRMERDYQMISRRYTKIFSELNRNLKNRVTELDRPILNFATTDTDQVINRGNLLISAVPVGQGESVKLSQTVMASNLKRRAAVALDSIKRFIESSNKLQAITDRILLSRSQDKDLSTLAVPVGIMENNFDASGNLQSQVQVSRIGMDDYEMRNIESTISSAQRDGDLQWKDSDSINPEVANYFRRMVSDSNLDERRRKLMLDLLEKNPFETL